MLVPKILAVRNDTPNWRTKMDISKYNVFEVEIRCLTVAVHSEQFETYAEAKHWYDESVADATHPANVAIPYDTIALYGWSGDHQDNRQCDELACWRAE
jgi:hypothetical protein